MLSFTVYGPPQPQGSMRVFTPKGCKRPIVTSDNVKLKPWRQEIAGTAKVEVAKQGFACIQRPGAVRMYLKFYFERPQSTKKTVGKTTKPDIDKLERAVFDALTGIVFEDDAQVTDVLKCKRFDAPARVEISVESVEQRAGQPDGAPANPPDALLG